MGTAWFEGVCAAGQKGSVGFLFQQCDEVVAVVGVLSFHLAHTEGFRVWNPGGRIQEMETSETEFVEVVPVNNDEVLATSSLNILSYYKSC